MDNSIPVLAVRNKLSEPELQFLLAWAKDPAANLAQVEAAAGLPPGAARALLQSDRGKRTISALLANPEERYAELRAQLVALVAKLAGWDPKDAFDENGALRHPRELPDEIRCAITSFQYYPANGSIEYKFESRLSAIKLLMQFLSEHDQRMAASLPDSERAQWVVRGRQEPGTKT